MLARAFNNLDSDFPEPNPPSNLQPITRGLNISMMPKHLPERTSLCRNQFHATNFGLLITTSVTKQVRLLFDRLVDGVVAVKALFMLRTITTTTHWRQLIKLQ